MTVLICMLLAVHACWVHAVPMGLPQHASCLCDAGRSRLGNCSQPCASIQGKAAAKAAASYSGAWICCRAELDSEFRFTERGNVELDTYVQATDAAGVPP